MWNIFCVKGHHPGESFKQNVFEFALQSWQSLAESPCLSNLAPPFFVVTTVVEVVPQHHVYGCNCMAASWTCACASWYGLLYILSYGSKGTYTREQITHAITTIDCIGSGGCVCVWSIFLHSHVIRMFTQQHTTGSGAAGLYLPGHMCWDGASRCWLGRSFLQQELHLSNC